MSKTIVVNINQTDNYDVYIGRAGKGYDGYFGNPFKNTSRSESIKQFKKYAINKINTDPKFKEAVKNLHGKKIGCFCKPKACHGDVLAELADMLMMEEEIFNTKENI